MNKDRDEASGGPDVAEAGSHSPAPERPAPTIGEALVRESLLDIEDQLTAGEHPGGPTGTGKHHGHE